MNFNDSQGIAQHETNIVLIALIVFKFLFLENEVKKNTISIIPNTLPVKLKLYDENLGFYGVR